MFDFKNKIQQLNPWYENKSFLFSEESLPKRDIFEKIDNYLDQSLIISITGLRRIGKTTILKQLINELLKKGIDVKNIFFYEITDETEKLDEILEFYFKNILKEDLYNTTCYIFLDELQFIKNWQEIIKLYYDINKNIKFIITGSTNLYIYKKQKESLTGRMIDIKLETLSWYEFIKFKYNKKYNNLGNIFNNNFIEECEKNSDILLYQKDLNSFIFYGEYPYYFNKDINIFSLKEYYQNSILEKIFLRDISFFDVENIGNIKNLFKILNKDTGSEINLSNISRDIGIDIKTIKRYVGILEKMFLFEYIYKDDKNLRTAIKSFKKGYIKSINLMSQLLSLDELNIEKDFNGHVIETFVYNEFKKNNINDIKFYNNKNTKIEIDFILEKNNIKLPIEVKTNVKLENISVNGLLKYSKENNIKRAIVFYGGEMIKRKKIDGLLVEFIPYIFI